MALNVALQETSLHGCQIFRFQTLRLIKPVPFRYTVPVTIKPPVTVTIVVFVMAFNLVPRVLSLPRERTLRTRLDGLVTVSVTN